MTAAKRRRTTLRVIGFDSGAHLGMDSRFVMISTAETFDVDFVHIEGLSGYRNYQRPAEIARYTDAWDALTLTAMSPADTLITLATVLAAT